MTEREVTIHKKINTRFESAYTRAVNRKPGLAMRGTGKGFHSDPAKRERADQHYMNSLMQSGLEALPDHRIPENGIIFCRAASDQFMAALDEADDDPRIAMGRWALAESAKRNGGYVPTWDSREAF